MPSYVGPAMANEFVSHQHTYSLEDQPQTPKGAVKAAMDSKVRRYPRDLAGFDQIVNGMSDHLSNGFTYGADDVPSTVSVDDQNGDQVNGHKFEPIAVIGLASRFAQDATSSTAFWRMLMEGKSALTDVPNARFNIDAFHQPGSNQIRGVRLILHVYRLHFLTRAGEIQRGSLYPTRYCRFRWPLFCHDPRGDCLYGPPAKMAA